MPTTCNINFINNIEKVFYTGQVLYGTAKLTLTSDKTVRGVYVEIYGKGYTHWTEQHTVRRNGKDETETRSYTGNEDYLCERKYFLGGPNGRFELRPGVYDHTFQCVLPGQLPTSVEGEYGWIRYGVRVVLDIPNWPDKEFNKSFTVLKTINLNVEPGMREPVVSENVKTFMPCGFLCCWESGPLRIIVRTPVGGYTPGQTINLTINIYNDSNEKITGVEARLIKHIDFYARRNGHGERHHKKSTKYLAGEDGNGCNVNQNKEIHLNLEVPSIPPTDCTTSNIIAVKYYIEVEAIAEGCCSGNLKASFPITIGTYPIQDNIMTQPMATQILPTEPHFQPTAPVMPPDSSGSMKMPLPDQPNDPTAPPSYDLETALNNDPPTYAEATGSDTQKESNFKPKYPMFKRQTSYSSGS